MRGHGRIISCFSSLFVLFYLAIVKKFEPAAPSAHRVRHVFDQSAGAYNILWGTWENLQPGEAPVYENVDAIPADFCGISSTGWENVTYPPLIFLGIGAMTDFGPLIANPRACSWGAGAQLAFLALILASLVGFDLAAACSIAIIGGADGPTAIYTTQFMSAYTPDDLLSAIAIAAYSYMALIPMIQKPLMRLIVPKKERAIKMKQLRKVSKLEKIIFPIAVTLIVGLLLPDAVPLLVCCARRPAPRIGRDGTSFFPGTERADEYNHLLPRRCGGLQGVRRSVPHGQDAGHYFPRRVRLHVRYGRRTSDRSSHVQAFARAD